MEYYITRDYIKRLIDLINDPTCVLPESVQSDIANAIDSNLAFEAKVAKQNLQALESPYNLDNYKQGSINVLSRK